MNYYRYINGQRYDSRLITQGVQLTKGSGDGRISNDDAKIIFQVAQDGPGITPTERNTILYLIMNLKWTDKAKEWIMGELDIKEEEVQPIGGAPEILMEFARHFYENSILSYFIQQYEAFLKDEELDARPFEDFQIDRNEEDLPEQVKASVQFYLDQIESKDIGAVRLHRIPFAKTLVDSRAKEEQEHFFITRTTTDGDDGWVELFTSNGDAMGYGRTYIELVSWGEKDDIRALTESSEFPADLDNRNEQTLWGK